MPNPFRFVPLFLLAVVTSPSIADEPASPPAAAPVNLHRPYQPGQTYEINFKLDHTLNSSGGRIDRDPTSNKRAYHYGLTGKIHDAQLDDHGKLKKFRVTVGHLTNEGRDSIRPGTVLQVEYENKEVNITQVDGKSMPDNAKPILKRLFPGFDLMDPSLDAGIGSKEPRKIGDSWEVDGKAAAIYLGEAYIQPFNITGTSTLKESPAGSNTRRLENKITVKDYHLPDAPTLAMLERATYVVTHSVLVPDDRKQPLLEFEAISSSDSLYSSPRGGVKASVQIHDALKQTIIPVDPKAMAAVAPATRPG